MLVVESTTDWAKHSPEGPVDLHVEKDNNQQVRGEKTNSSEPKWNKCMSHSHHAASERIAMATAEQVPPAARRSLLQSLKLAQLRTSLLASMPTPSRLCHCSGQKPHLRISPYFIRAVTNAVMLSLATVLVAQLCYSKGHSYCNWS